METRNEAEANLEQVWTEDGVPVRLKLMRFMQSYFSEMLGPDILLLDQPGGLQKLRAKYEGLLLARQERERRSAAA